LIAVNDLWREVYPYLAAQIMAAYGRTSGRVLELGPFSGGISYEMAARHPALEFILADDHREYLAYLKGEIQRRNLSRCIEVVDASLDNLPFGDASFDLVILRGAFFFIMERPHILSQIHRVLAPGGLAFVGGGYGKDIPQSIIDSIVEESRILNDRLGRRRTTLNELKSIVRANRLEEQTTVVEDGGVWLLVRKSVSLAEEKKTSRLAEAFDLRTAEVISLVGGGGKTSLMFTLAHELSNAGKKVISTTTTRILEPAAEESPCLIVEEDEERLLSRLKEELCRHSHVTAVRLKSDDGKLKGLLPETVDRLAAMRLADYIINEADGAARKPIKSPNATEPVIPTSTTLVVAVVGVDALNSPLSQEIAFRPEIITRLTGLSEGGIITPEVIATLVTDEKGIIQHTPRKARIVPFINKVELARHPAEVKNLAAAILSRRHPQIQRVVSGSLRAKKPEFHIFEAA
jgi:probable selenium-dependent hydroxylase accessory protein YqeC